MPIIQVDLLEGRTVEQKRAFAKAVTELATQTLACPPEAVQVVFNDKPRHDWAKAGVLMLDAVKK